nr:MAG TPA: hypothetical protein [Caudoviricetes sp.]
MVNCWNGVIPISSQASYITSGFNDYRKASNKMN